MPPPPKTGRKRKRKAALFHPKKRAAADANVTAVANAVSPAAHAVTTEINRIIRGGYDYGDRQLAFQTLGMLSTPGNDYILPGVLGFLAHVNAMIARLHPSVIDLTPYPQSTHRNRWFRARQACEMVLMAIRTIGGFQNEYWFAQLQWAPFVINYGDLRPGATWDDSNPMTADQFSAYKAGLPKGALGLAGYDDPRLDPPTTNEVIAECWNRVGSHATDRFRQLPRSQARIAHNPNVLMWNIPTIGDGNCFWYAVGESLYGHGSWTAFAQIKANLRKFVMSVLNNPKHIRYRTYCYLQAASVRMDGRRGGLSFVRCLHACSKNQRRGRWPICDADIFLWPLNQAIADYYDIEFCQFDEEGENPIDILPLYQNPLIRGRKRDPNVPDKPQAWIFKDAAHHTGALPANVPANARFPFRLNLREDIGNEVSKLPWHPIIRTAPAMTRRDLPRYIKPEQRFANPEMRASQSDVDYVVANRNFPQRMPRLPLTRAEMDAKWDVARDLEAPLFPGGTMPTCAGHLSLACYGTPPHVGLPCEKGPVRDWQY